MRSWPDAFGPTPDECAADLLDAFDLGEVIVCQFLRFVNRKPEHIQRGLLAGRLQRTTKNGRMNVRKTCTRLSYREARRTKRRASDAFESLGKSSYVVLRHAATSAVVRLPFA